MLRKNHFPVLFILIVLIISCTPKATTSTPDVLATIVAETLSVIQVDPIGPPATQVPQFTPLITVEVPTSTLQTASEVIKVVTSTNNVNLRVGPGKLFQVSRVLANGTQLELLGLAPGSNWMQVINNEGILGWVDGLFLNGDFDILTLPSITPTNAVTITGFVTNDNGPITYLGIALVQAQGDQFDEAFTDDTGKYYIYVPNTLTGEWFLQEYGTDCRSNTMDSNCKCLSNPCGNLTPAFYRLTFPLANTFYRFGWQ